MQEQHLYEYAVIRVVPCVEREEFVNVGIVLFCKRQNAIRMHWSLNEGRIKAFSDTIDLQQVQDNLGAFSKIAAGAPDGGPIAAMDAASRFRWLTAVRSSMIQTTRPHPGLSFDLDRTAQRLFSELVL